MGLFSWLHSTAPSQWNCRILAALLSTGSPMYWISCSLLLFRAWPWDFRKHLACECVCADSAACHRATWPFELCFLQTSQIYVLSSCKTYWAIGWVGWGGWVSMDGWVTYHLMLPLLHNPFQRGESAEGATKQNNWRQRKKEKRLPSL